jgi:hypothetical protein
LLKFCYLSYSGWFGGGSSSGSKSGTYPKQQWGTGGSGGASGISGGSGKGGAAGPPFKQARTPRNIFSSDELL